MPALRYLTLMFCLSFWVPTATIADGVGLDHGKIISFHNASTPEERKFAEEQIITYFRDESGPLLEGPVSEWKLKLAEADLDEDGFPEKIVMINDNYWCGSAGCQGLILRKDGARWSLVERPTISEERTILVKDSMDGYQKLYTGNYVYVFKNGKPHHVIDLDAN
jgi:hypothetical protein